MGGGGGREVEAKASSVGRVRGARRRRPGQVNKFVGGGGEAPGFGQRAARLRILAVPVIYKQDRLGH
jgi:hypothetical protein